MKKVLAAMCLAIAPCCAFSQFAISGTISDSKTNELVVGATITMDNYFAAVQSDATGSFVIENLKSGKYIIQTSLLGFEKHTDTVELSKNTTLNIQLKESSLLMDEVTVNATRADNNSAMAYTNVSKQDIAKQNLGQDLPYLLNMTPSTVVTSDGGNGVGYTGLRIRGSDANSINVTINGIPVNDAESQGTFWVDLPDIASSIDNVQVQRGVGTSTNGAGAFGGSLNIQTTKLNPMAYAEVNSSAGSFSTLKNTVNVGTGLIDGKWAVDARLSKINSDGYIDRASTDLKSYYLSGAYYGKKTIIKAIVFSGIEKTYQAWYGVPEDSLKACNRTFNQTGMYFDGNGKFKYYDNQTDNYQQDYYQLHLSHELNTNWNISAALHYTKGRGYYEEYNQADLLSNYSLQNVIIGIDTITKSDIIRRQWLDNDFYGATYSLKYNDHKKLTTTFGGALNQYSGLHYGEVIWAQYASNGAIRDKYYDNKAVKTDFNVYLRANYQLIEKLNVFADMQYRMAGYSFLGYDKSLNNVQQKADLNFFNPKLGLTYNVDPSSYFYLSYSVGNKEPNRNDYTQSSPTSRPKAETLNDFELGYKQNMANAYWAINFYNMNYKNQLVPTGKLNDVGAANRINVDNSHRKGLELEGAINITKQIKVGANATFSENRVKKFDEYITDYDNGGQQIISYSKTNIAFSPNFIASAQLVYEPIKDLSFSFISKQVGKQYLDNTSNADRMLKAYFIEDFRFRYQFKTKWIKQMGVNFYINNLLNKKYESNGYTYNYFSTGKILVFNSYYPQAGTNFMLGLNLKF